MFANRLKALVVRGAADAAHGTAHTREAAAKCHCTTDDKVEKNIFFSDSPTHCRSERNERPNKEQNHANHDGTDWPFVRHVAAENCVDIFDFRLEFVGRQFPMLAKLLVVFPETL
eukprot:987709_1